jgi:hypothetical protein
MPIHIPNFEILRRVAETASGFRYKTTYVTVKSIPDPTATDGGGYSIAVSHEQPTQADDVLVFEISPVTYPEPPQVSGCSISCGQTTINLLEVEIAPDPEEGFAGGTCRADAVFWSLSAVEKFATPYYASVYGDAGGQVVQTLVSSLKPAAASVTDELVPDEPSPVFALAHLPSSEYIMESEAGTQPQLYTLHLDGKARHVRRRPAP